MKLYTDIEQTPLHAVFLRCLLDGELNALIIEGEPTEAELQQAWANLYADYVDLTGGPSALHLLTLQRDIAVLEFKMMTVGSALNLLMLVFDERVVQVLADMGYDTQDIALGNPKMPRALKLIKAKLAPLKLALKTKRKELAELSQEEGEPMTYKHFSAWCVRLTRFMRVPVRLREVMTGEYAQMIQQYIDHYQKQSNGSEQTGKD